ncbi:flagellin [Teredinibacter turnerae]|uniref:Flagellin n=1 Tax=Teredinibacter turnerae (strain ATCC 39867 / T7901) TaxID=377629 RepID=C5BRZ2_TERTT|nr:flagellin [Teredinibacter turnerae]ACR13496.1 A-type flagellin [Teredinibacter turnerae T7901]
MPLVVNSNIPSLNAQRQLLQSGAALDKASERLASGKRINSAADDAAGLAISNRQTSQIRGLDQAVRNANDGISLIQTAEGALDETTNILQRMRELAIQSSNGIYSDDDRTTLDAEVQQLKAEIDRIADTTSFNGQNILDGSLGDVNLQVGSESNQTISFNIRGFNSSNLGGAGGDVIGAAVGSGTAGVGSLSALAGGDELVINDVAISSLSTAATVNDALEIINADLEGKGAEVSTLVSVEAASAGDGQLIEGTDTMQIEVEDGDGNLQTFILTGTTSMDELVDKINNETIVSASLSDDGKLVLSAEGVESIEVTGNTTAAQEASGFSGTGVGGNGIINKFSLVFTDTSGTGAGVKIEAGTGATAAEIDALGLNVQDDDGNLLGAALTANASADINAGDLIINGVEIGKIEAGTDIAGTVTEVIDQINKLSSETGVVAFEAGDGANNKIGLRATSGDPIAIEYGSNATAANVYGITGLNEQNAAVGAGSIRGVDISTAANAQRAIDVIDSALEQINDTRSDLGAINNRLDFTVSNLANISEKTAASRSRIMDADFASETAQLSRAQVLQQASQAMLAQANARPQQVLSLLQ